jgi:hypothetical protein
MAQNQKTRDDDARGGSPDGRGNAPHEFSEAMAVQIEKMGGLGLRQKDMALILGISEDTIQRHYRDHYQRGKARMGMTLNNRAFDLAMGKLKDPDDPSKGYETPPNITMIIWLQKSQFGYRETSRHEIVNPDGPQEGGHSASDEVASRLERLAEPDDD